MVKNSTVQNEQDREFYIDHDGIRLHAKLEFPAARDENGKCPLLILLHGYTGHMEETHLLGVKDAAEDAGFAVLRIELYGHGQSGGTFREHTVLKWVSEMMTVIDYAGELDFVTNLYLAGHSQGGFVTAMAGAMKQDVLRAIILLSPALSIPEDARRGCALGSSFDPEHVPQTVLMDGDRLLSGNYFRAAQMVDLDTVIRRYQKPVLIVHGDEDESVPVECAIDAAKAYSQAELVLIKGDTHCYDRHLDQVTEAVAEYLRKMESQTDLS